MLYRIKFRLHGNNKSEKFVFTIEDGTEFFLDSFFRPSLEKNEHTSFFIQQEGQQTILHFLQTDLQLNGELIGRKSIELKPGQVISWATHHIEIIECPIRGQQKNEITQFLDFRPFRKSLKEPKTAFLEPTDSVRFAPPAVQGEVEFIRGIWKLLAAGCAMCMGLVAFIYYFPKMSTPPQARKEVVLPKVISAVEKPKVSQETKSGPVFVSPVQSENRSQSEQLAKLKSDFFSAIKDGDIEKINHALLNSAISPDFTVDAQGKTPLIAAAASGRLGVVKYLMQKKVNVNAQDFEGSTALIWAVLGKNEEMANYLLANGANPSTRREDGKSAQDLARITKSKSLVKITNLRKSPLGKSKRFPASKK